MAMSVEEGVRNIRYFMETYLPSRPDLADSAIRAFTSTAVNLKLGVERAYKEFVDVVPIDVGFYGKAFPGYEIDEAALADPIGYGHAIPAALIVDFYYAGAPVAERDLLVSALEKGIIDHYDFLHGWTSIAPEQERPAAAAVLYAIYAAGHGNPELPAWPLEFVGLEQEDVAFLVGVYVAAFSRAPEYEGLAYWANELADGMERGLAPPDAYKHVAALMQASGAGAGEVGAGMDDRTYVDYLYQSALGRPAERDGQDYWLSHLAAGGDRGEFIAVMLASGLESAGDDLYLHARIAVAGYAAQASADPGRIDLAGLLTGVHNTATARAAIDLLEHGIFDLAPLDDTAEADPAGEVGDHAAAEVELVGLAVSTVDAVGHLEPF